MFALISMAAAAPASETVPERWITLAPHLTELAFAAGAGDRLVGAVEWSDFPEAARALPRIGDAWRIDFERILELRADLVLAWGDTTPPAAIQRLEALGLRVEAIDIDSMDDISAAIRRLADFTDDATAGKVAARRFEDALSKHRQTRDKDAAVVSVFYEVSAQPLFTLGGTHPINEVLALCGAQNLFADVPGRALNVDLEAVLRRKPDAIVVGRDASQPEPIEPWKPLQEMRAVSCGHVLEVDPALLVRPTPRVLQGVAKLCQWLDTAVRGAPERSCRPRAPSVPRH